MTSCNIWPYNSEDCGIIGEKSEASHMAAGKLFQISDSHSVDSAGVTHKEDQLMMSAVS